jgi:hypothetical protein
MNVLLAAVISAFEMTSAQYSQNGLWFWSYGTDSSSNVSINYETFKQYQQNYHHSHHILFSYKYNRTNL